MKPVTVPTEVSIVKVFTAKAGFIMPAHKVRAVNFAFFILESMMKLEKQQPNCSRQSLEAPFIFYPPLARLQPEFK
jgi:hypothetical protein